MVAADTIPLRPAPEPAEAAGAAPSAARPSRPAPAVEALLLDAREAAALCGVGRSTWLRMVSAGRCPAPIHLSRGAVRWSRETLVEWIRMGCPSRKEFEARKGASSRR